MAKPIKSGPVKMYELDEIQSLAAQGYQDLNAGLVKLEAVGEGCEGTYISSGKFGVFDPASGEVRDVAFYLFEKDGRKFRLNGKTILDGLMAVVTPGQYVVIVRRPDVTTGRKRKAADFSVFAK